MALPRLTVILGPTASGKTGLGIRLAKETGAAVLSADSRQIYAGMNIGTAKPEEAHSTEIHKVSEPQTIETVPHYFFNIREPNQTYDLATWQHDVFNIIDGLHDKKTPPLLVGGTMLYIDSVAFNFSIPDVPPNPQFRQDLEKEEVTTLYQELLTRDPHARAFVEAGNKRRIIRALEVIQATDQPFSAQRLQHEPKYDVKWVGLFPGWDTLRSRIDHRNQQMIDSGLLDETADLQKRYGDDLPLLRTLNYRQASSVLAGTLPLTSLQEELTRANVRYAHRQMSWWNRNEEIQWFTDPESAYAAIR